MEKPKPELTSEQLAQAVLLLNELTMWRKLAKHVPIDSMERWRLSAFFMNARRELEGIVGKLHT